MEIKSSENQLDFLSNRFESLVENGLDCVLIISETAETKYVSRSIMNILGYTPDEVMKMNAMEFIHPDDVAESQETILRAIQSPGKPIQGRVARVRHKNGSWLWIDAVVTNMLHDPAINGIVDNFRDVTDKVIAEQKANESAQRLFFATQGAKIGIWERDLITNQMECDDMMYELYGLEKHSFDNTVESWEALVHPDYRPIIQEKIEGLISRETEFNLEFSIIRPNGSTRYIKSIAHLQKDNKGNPIRIIGTNWDITESRKSNEKFRNLLETAPDAMVIFNEKNIIELVNSETERMFGYSKLELIGKSVEILLPYTLQKNTFVQNNNQSNPQKALKKCESSDLFAIKKNGEKFPVEINLGTLHTGDELLISAVIRDITLRKKTEVILRNMAALEAKNEEMEQLAYITSHDLREPLLTMKKYSQVLQKMFNETLGNDGKILLGTIIRSADRMEERINDLLNYSQLGQVKNLEQLDSNDTLKFVIEDLNSLIELNEAQVIINDLPTSIKAYPTKLQLIFQNLINNAIKFREKDTPPIVHISSKKTEEGWEFQVADNGIGIDEKDYKKIFSIFQKLHNASEYKGSGIGLAQVKKLVELHNGQIWVQSKIGKGTTFSFSINTENL